MKSYGETLMCKFLNILLPMPHIDNYRPDWLQNPKSGLNLELDRYYPTLKAGFEYQGERHHQPTTKRRQLDRLKVKLCQQNGVILIQVNPRDLHSTVLRSKCNYIFKQRRLGQVMVKYNFRKLNWQAKVYRQRLVKRYGRQLGVGIKPK